MMSVNPNIQTFHIKRILIHKSMQTRCCIFKSIHTECVHTQVCILRTFFSCWWMGTHASARRSAHSRPLLWSSHSAARLHYYGTGFEEWRPPNERTHLHVWVPGCVANWFLGFLESREMSAQITHSYLGRRIEGGRTCWTKLVLTMGPAEKCVHPLWAETLSVTGHPASCSLN